MWQSMMKECLTNTSLHYIVMELLAWTFIIKKQEYYELSENIYNHLHEQIS